MGWTVHNPKIQPSGSNKRERECLVEGVVVVFVVEAVVVVDFVEEEEVVVVAVVFNGRKDRPIRF